MLIKIKLFTISALIFLTSLVRSDEGMWIPLLLKKYNIEDMQKKGFKLSAEDIYSVNQACMKDAIVIFGRGCTGELISDKGLVLTNHHCGYGQIQSHSTIEKDYLTNGFWAMNNSEELSNPGLTVTFLIRMEDVTEKALEGVKVSDDEVRRERLIKQNITKLEEENSEGKKYEISVKPFYYGNEYYMFVYQTYKDVRLVGAPHSSIGKFGGDTDNWMWPRHTGDFSLFRIYADKNNNPAEYSPENVPYKPKMFFPISLKGVKKGDFTMVFGYPGTTEQYLTSHAVKMIMEDSNPHKINIRKIKLDIMKADMDASDAVRIQYSSKYAGVANYWKKWIGENKGLKKLDAVRKKQELEERFSNWLKTKREMNTIYGNVLVNFEKIYREFTPIQTTYDYISEALLSLDLIKFAGNFRELSGELTEDQLIEISNSLKGKAKAFFKDYNLPTSKKLVTAMIKIYRDSVSTEYHPEAFKMINSKFKGDLNKYVDYLFENSILVSNEKLDGFFEKLSVKSAKKILEDPVYKIYADIVNVYVDKLLFALRSNDSKLNTLYRQYINGLREFQKDKIFYPDANFTMRITYGQVDDYYPNDGVFYEHFTTLKGIMEKDDPAIYDYDVPQKLRELYAKKDYGRYADADGSMHVCFIASNHTTGGNSGSPVINANGELIGLNFDRNWEGTMSDIMYNPDQCRNISMDVRYLLFIIDKFAGASHLIEEMNIIE
ncbi:MAG: S46 family peptidase [Bacteroidales bacterium]|nr:S46 family peptidase [Bacteroidales bacterium]